jgi:hypothetical protein
MKTGIFSTSQAARDASLSRVPELERHCRPALIEMGWAFEKAGADDPEVTVDAVTKALFRDRFSARTVVGRRTSAMLMLSCFRFAHETGW